MSQKLFEFLYCLGVVIASYGLGFAILFVWEFFEKVFEELHR